MHSEVCYMQLCKSRPGVMQRRDKLHRRCKVAKMASITENCMYICIPFKEALQSNLPPNVDLQHKWWKVLTTRLRVMAEKNASHGVLTSRSAEWWPGVKLQCYCCEFTVLLLLLLLLLVAFLPVNLNSCATQSRIYHLVQEGGRRPKRFPSGIFG